MPATSDSNPYQSLLYEHLAAFGYALSSDSDFGLRWLWHNRGRVELLHFHWRVERCYHRRPARALTRRLNRRGAWVIAWLQAAGFVGRLLVARALGYRLVWTLHELYRQTQVATRVEQAVGAALGRLADVVFVHDRHCVDGVRTQLGVPERRLRVVAHPSYLGVYPVGRGREKGRERIGVGEKQFVYLHFGTLRPDKQLNLLLDSFHSIRTPDAVLVIAGAPRGDVSALLETARRDPRIVLRLGQVPDDHVSELFAAADVFVNPCGDGWTSGSLILALSMGVPAIVADRDQNRALIGEDEAGWVFRPDDAAALAEALGAAAAQPEARQRKAAAALGRAHALPRWSDLAEQTAQAITLTVSPDLTSRGLRPRGQLRSRGHVA